MIRAVLAILLATLAVVAVTLCGLWIQSRVAPRVWVVGPYGFKSNAGNLRVWQTGEAGAIVEVPYRAAAAITVIAASVAGSAVRKANRSNR